MKTLRDCFDSFDGRIIGKIDHFFDDYEAHLAGFVGAAPRILEIGVHGGGSLELWQLYFDTGAIVHGLDIDPAAAEAAPESAVVHIGSQADTELLRQVTRDHGPFDIIIDDGSHLAGDQVASFEALYSSMSPTGVYICEDTFTSYWQEYGGSTDAQDTFISYAKRLVDELHSYWRMDDDVSATEFTRSTAAVHFYSGAVVFQRRPMAAPEYVVRTYGAENRISAGDLKTAAGKRGQ